MQPTKERILSVVIEHIKEGINLDKLTLSQIAKTAHIGKSTVYEYFESKERLITETYMYLLDVYESTLIAPLEQTTFEKAFVEQTKKILIVMKDAQIIMDAIFNQNLDGVINIGDNVKKRVKLIQTKMNLRFEHIFMMGIQEGIVSIHPNPYYQKNIIQAIISGMLYQYVNQELEIDEATLCQVIYDYVVKIING